MNRILHSILRSAYSTYRVLGVLRRAGTIPEGGSDDTGGGFRRTSRATCSAVSGASPVSMKTV